MTKHHPTLSAHRELHLIDIENELGTGRIHAADVARFRDFYYVANNVSSDAHIVIGASSSQGLLEAGLGWPGARRVFRHGHDGADLALLEVAHSENVDSRFERVVFATGDHIFAEDIVRLRSLGVEVDVFARAVHLSHYLQETGAAIHTFSAADFCLAA